MLRDGEFLAPALVPVSGQPVREPLRCRPDAAYLITGGLGALGLLMADWLADRGARRLVLAGRTALPPRRDWDSDTSTRMCATRSPRSGRWKCVASPSMSWPSTSVPPEAVQALLATRDRDGAPPIRGVIHAAGVTESKLLTETADDALPAGDVAEDRRGTGVAGGFSAGQP